MLATYDPLTALHTSCPSDTLPSPHPPHRGGGGGKVDPTSIIHMLRDMSTISYTKPPTYSVHTGPWQWWGQGGCRAEPYIYIYTHMYILIYIYTYIHKYIRTYVHVHTCIHAYMHACMHTCMHVCMHTYVRTYIHACIYIYTKCIYI